MSNGKKSTTKQAKSRLIKDVDEIEVEVVNVDVETKMMAWTTKVK